MRAERLSDWRNARRVEDKRSGTFPWKPRARIRRSFYSKANEAMQAQDAARATRMPISRGIPALIRKRFQSMWAKRFRACGATLILGIWAPAGVSQQAQETPNRLELSVTVRPESATILYASDTFAVRETFFVPVQEQGAVILLDVETEHPLEIEASFHRDFQLEWPAALGATYLDWAKELRAFYFGEEQRKFAALVGSPTAAEPRSEYQTNYSESQESSFRLGATAKGRETKLIVISGSVEGR